MNCPPGDGTVAVHPLVAEHLQFRRAEEERWVGLMSRPARVSVGVSMVRWLMPVRAVWLCGVAVGDVGGFERGEVRLRAWMTEVCCRRLRVGGEV